MSSGGFLDLFLFILTALSVCYVILGFDDFFIDLVAWMYDLGPQELEHKKWKKVQKLPQKKIAILVAAWKEDGVITSMIRGNSQHLDYENYKFVIGVYPNDLETLTEAQALARQYDHVEVVVNRKDGPTSKGQMLNEMLWSLSQDPRRVQPDIYMIHDAEDIIHPLSLKVVNWRADFSDFIQVPVFSLSVPLKQLVAGLYADEFAESHTKDMFVRQYLGAPIPSAGVGTAMTAKYIQKLSQKQGGRFLNPHTVTEDYQLGLLSQELGLKSEFACYYTVENKKKKFIATREYFPKSFFASIRQRSRWVLGIAFQGYEHLGWRGSMAHKYFLYRDRKGPIASVLTLLGIMVFLVGMDLVWSESLNPYSLTTSILIVTSVNLFFACNRLFQRFLATRSLYGVVATLLILPRLLVGNLINAFASIRASYQYCKYLYAKETPKWLKTTHEMPIGFGNVQMIAILFLAGLLTLPSTSYSQDKVCVYYDDASLTANNENDAIAFTNLMGHFKDFKVSRVPVEKYKSKDMEKCQMAAYISSVYERALPEVFLKDVSHFTKNFMWIGNKIEQLQSLMGEPAFTEAYGFTFHNRLTKEPTFSPLEIAQPQFYQDFIYKGETFQKKIYNYDNGTFAFDPEINVVKSQSASVLSYAKNPHTGKKIPYILLKNNFYYIADAGFSFMHESDRYLIVADLLFDFLKAAIEKGNRQALLRLEDIHPNYHVPTLYKVFDVLKKHHVSYGISLIPRFISGPDENGQRITVDMRDRPEFMKALEYAQANGAKIFMHGFTHQLDGLTNCAPTDSGDDFEFWDKCHNQPPSFDSKEFVRDRLNQGLALIKEMGLNIVAWVTPHYSASPNGYRVFAEYFPRTIQRVLYMNESHEAMNYQNLISQFFPYTIYKDYYGQFVWPENLGYVSAENSLAAARVMSADIKRNTVLRDVWASFYFHPFVANAPNGVEALELILETIQKNNYHFINFSTNPARHTEKSYTDFSKGNPK